MNSKNAIICVVFGVLLLSVLIFLFVGDSKNESILKVGDRSYDIKDFEDYVKVWNYEEDSSASDLSAMYQNFQSYKVYYTRSDKAGVTLEDDEKPAELESGDAERLMADYNLTEEDYIRVKSEMALANKLYASPYKLAKISPDYFTGYKTNVIESDSKAYDTYNYRVVQINLPPDVDVEEEPELDISGDISGDVSGEETKEPEVTETSGEKLAREKAEAKAKIDKVIELTKMYIELESGESSQDLITKLGEALEVESGEVELDSGDTEFEFFDYLAKATPDVMRYTQNTNGFSTKANGALDTSARMFIQEDLTSSQTSYVAMFGGLDLSEKIVNNIVKLKEGEVSNVFETDDGYAFVYLESVDHELSEADEERFLNEVARAYIEQNANMTFNKVLVKKINLEELMPKVARDAEEARKQAEASGDVVEENAPETDASQVETTGNEGSTDEVIIGGPEDNSDKVE